jgi:endogenous inhibitor of DNA gyrase (YacG/DUF329 family)
MDFKCPICGKVIPSLSATPEGKKQINAPFFPFCSERCRWIDLGAWLREDYRVPTAGRILDKESRGE